MPHSPLENVVAHWSKLFEGFQASPRDFYDRLEFVLKTRLTPGLKTARVVWDEGGVLAPRREYLRVTGERHIFDICAAPFGTGFFFSLWVTKNRARFVVLYWIVFVLVTGFIWQTLSWAMGQLYQGSQGLGGLVLGFLYHFGLGNPFVLVPLSFLILLGVIAFFARAGNCGPELAVLATPLVGPFYQRVFAPETYYRIDTMLMFQSVVHGALLEAIDDLTTQKGLRALTDDERKPVFTQLA